MAILIKIFGKNARERGAWSVSIQEIALETDFLTNSKLWNSFLNDLQHGFTNTWGRVDPTWKLSKKLICYVRSSITSFMICGLERRDACEFMAKGLRRKNRPWTGWLENYRKITLVCPRRLSFLLVLHYCETSSSWSHNRDQNNCEYDHQTCSCREFSPSNSPPLSRFRDLHSSYTTLSNIITRL